MWRRPECLIGSHNILNFYASRHERRVIVVRAFPDLLADAENEELGVAARTTAAESEPRGKVLGHGVANPNTHKMVAQKQRGDVDTPKIATKGSSSHQHYFVSHD